MDGTHLKEKIRHELTEYFLNVIYLALVFATFTIYRRLLLAAYDIRYTNYWVAVIEALILGKVIMIGSIFRLGRGMESRPLIYPTLYKSVVFGVLVGLFKLFEHGIKDLWNRGSAAADLAALTHDRFDELLANSLVVFVALIPFFAVKELSRVLGRQRIASLFFRRVAVEEDLR